MRTVTRILLIAIVVGLIFVRRSQVHDDIDPQAAKMLRAQLDFWAKQGLVYFEGKSRSTYQMPDDPERSKLESENTVRVHTELRAEGVVRAEFWPMHTMWLQGLSPYYDLYETLVREPGRTLELIEKQGGSSTPPAESHKAKIHLQNPKQLPCSQTAVGETFLTPLLMIHEQYPLSEILQNKVSHGTLTLKFVELGHQRCLLLEHTLKRPANVVGPPALQTDRCYFAIDKGLALVRRESNWGDIHRVYTATDFTKLAEGVYFPQRVERDGIEAVSRENPPHGPALVAAHVIMTIQKAELTKLTAADIKAEIPPGWRIEDDRTTAMATVAERRGLGIRR